MQLERVVAVKLSTPICGANLKLINPINEINKPICITLPLVNYLPFSLPFSLRFKNGENKIKPGKKRNTRP